MKKYFKTMFALMLFGAVLFIACGGDDGSDNPPAATYAIGDTGPSGVGTVFYITNGGVHGMEVAPANWNPNGSGDPQPTWIEGDYQVWNFNGNTSTEPGTGLANSNAIMAQPGHTGSAAKVCRDYNGGGKTDWFLPSIDELEDLFNQISVMDGYENEYYWSSSEIDANTAYVAKLYNKTRTGKNTPYYVRPVRAF
ncbi:MAG: DUF1566 domain-containing protein [Spirochaetota bacterium]